MDPFVETAAVEAPNQRGITERHGKTFKFMLLKAMDNYNCQNTREWEQLIDEVVMTKNRLLQNNGFFTNATCFLGLLPEFRVDFCLEMMEIEHCLQESGWEISQ